MIYKNIEIHNAAHIVETKNGFTWLRVPEKVRDGLDGDGGKEKCANATGVELRFVIRGDKAVIKMRALSRPGVLNTFHVYYGAIQGGWQDHEVNKFVSSDEVCEFEIARPENMETLKKISDQFSYEFSPEVVRIIFDRGSYEIVDIEGDIEPPKARQLPKKTLMAYGSSITHGSNALDASHMWTAVLAHNLNMDMVNLGMAGNCFMEKAMIDYIADEGVNGNWDILTLELGINALDWDEEKINERVYYAVQKTASENPKKNIFVISPLYCCDDFNGGGKAAKWRRLIEANVKKLNLKNVRYINGLDLIGDMSFISADEVHPNIYGAAQIAERLTGIIKNFKD